MATMIVCPKCKKVDKVKATYTCHSTLCGTRTWTLGPQPQGVPISQPCPGCKKDTLNSGWTCLRCPVD